MFNNKEEFYDTINCENNLKMHTLIDPAVLTVFIPTFFVVSATPGMCMTLSMTLGMTIGLRRTFWMMWGELIGVGLISVAAVIGVAAIMLKYPTVFLLLKFAGGSYLCYLGIQMWRSRGKMALSENSIHRKNCTGIELAMQGFFTAIANPKGWAFMISLLPPFIDPAIEFVPQMLFLLAIILTIEFCCLILYATGGKTLRRFLQNRHNVQTMNRVAGTMMLGVGGWLAFF
jgi:homoserine/homoserine lactone efflux protein